MQAIFNTMKSFLHVTVFIVTTNKSIFSTNTRKPLFKFLPIKNIIATRWIMCFNKAKFFCMTFASHCVTKFFHFVFKFIRPMQLNIRHFFITLKVKYLQHNKRFYKKYKPKKKSPSYWFRCS